MTRECDYPPAAPALPRVTRASLALDGMDGGAIVPGVRLGVFDRAGPRLVDSLVAAPSQAPATLR